MRIGIFSECLTLPPKEGINVHAYGVAKALACVPDTEVLFVVCDRGWLNKEILNQQPFDTLVLPNEDFYNPQVIAKIVEDYSLDVLQTYMIFFASLVLGKASYETRVPMAVEFHDLEKTIAPLYVSDEEEVAFHDSLQYRAGCLASMVRVMSAYDYTYVKKVWTDFAKTATWMPVSIKDPGIEVGSRQVIDNSVLFIGNTSYPPNEAAAKYIEGSLAPQLTDIKFSLVGRGTERFTGQNIEPNGMVDDIEKFLRTHALGLAPIFEGSGMKIKLLDYLSAGMPVVTTSLGAYGYPESKAIIVEDNVDKWPEIIKSLLNDSDKLAHLSEVARKLFMDHFNLDSNIDKLVEAYRDLKYSTAKTPADFEDIPIDQGRIHWLKEIREVPNKPVAKQVFYEGAKKC